METPRNRCTTSLCGASVIVVFYRSEMHRSLRIEDIFRKTIVLTCKKKKKKENKLLLIT